MKKLRPALLVVVASAALLELVLQAGAVAVWLTHTRPAEPAVQAEVAAIDPDAARVLCIGDSFTYGDGASSSEHSYPAVLERLLAERIGKPVQVTNAGFRIATSPIASFVRLRMSRALPCHPLRRSNVASSATQATSFP